MNSISIRTEKLGKAYRIGATLRRSENFREALSGFFTAPFRRLRELAAGPPPGDEPAGADPARGGSIWALRDVSFDVQEGEALGIIGRNGAGKSTLLKILSRITDPSEGRVELRGRVGSLLEIGTGFHPDLTGRENIFLNGAILGMSRKEVRHKLPEIVAFAEVEQFLDTPVKRYSSGMYMRLAFSVAAHLEPDILIVDEVLAVGDHEFQKRCMGKMQSVARAGRTVLFVSHNLPVVRNLCQRCCVLEKGRLVFLGEAADGVAYYLKGLGSDTGQASVRFPAANTDAPAMTAATLSSAGESKREFFMGDPLTLEVEFRSPFPLRYAKLGWVISTLSGDKLLGANNRFLESNALEEGITHGRITCDLGVVPLMAGEYFVSLWFGDPAHDSHIEQNVIRFEILEKIIWGQGRLPRKGSYLLWWPTRFHIERGHIERNHIERSHIERQEPPGAE